MTPHANSQSEYIVKKFGGITKLARALGHKNITTVQGWKVRGFVPARQQPLVMEAAHRLGIRLRPKDFFRTMSSG